MGLRGRSLLYLSALHAGLAGLCVVVARDHPALILVLEGLLLASAVAGYAVVRSFFVPLQLIRTGAQLIAERDFTSQFRFVGQAEIDDLIRLYNRMIERLREERLKLREQEQFLGRVLQASPAGVLTLDHDGRVSQMNPSAGRLLGFSEEKAAGRSLAEMEAGPARDMAALGVGESRVLHLSGLRRLKCARGEFYDCGFPRSFYTVEELTDELRASEKEAYGKLIRQISHEVNNSVGAVSSLLESCRTYADQLQPPDRTDFLGAIDVAVTRMHSLGSFMKGFAEVVRLPAPQRRPCDLRGLAEEIACLIRPQAEKRAIRLTISSDPGLPSLLADRDQMGQVLLNLLANAMEAIGEHGAITLELRGEEERVVLRLRDSGPGIPPEVRSKLFTPFFSTKRDGRGLGLTIIQEILSNHGFGFGLENRAEGGAEFLIRT
jgi:nitrogen fixation/metabolism regulation signal transduction histidine kinase